MPQNLNEQPWYPRHPKDELSGPTIALTCEELGLLQRLRDYSWENGGIPADEAFLRRLAKVFQLSPYKWRKLWPVIENFFDRFEGFFTYDSDEQERRIIQDLSAKRKVSGILGAEARWKTVKNRRNQVDITDSKTDGKAMASAIPFATSEAMANDGQPQLQPQGDPPTPYPSPNMGDAGLAAGAVASLNEPDEVESPPVQRDPGTAVTADSGFRLIAEHCRQLGMEAASPKLVRELLKKFTGLSPGEVIQHLPRFSNQQSPGLWAQKSRLELVQEAERQLESPERKPSSREERYARLLDWAREIDRREAVAK